MRIELKLEEVDRGRLKLGQAVRIRVDAIPDKEFTADARLDQPDRLGDFQADMDAGEDVPRARHSQESRSAAAAGHERHGRNRDRARAQPAC